MNCGTKEKDPGKRERTAVNCAAVLAAFSFLFLLYAAVKTSPYRLLRPYALIGKTLPEKLGAETKTIAGRKAVLIPGNEETDAFFIDQIPVTVSDYQKCVKSGGCAAAHYRNEFSKYTKNPLYGIFPVTFVTWNEARNYCVLRGGDLPTEKQWEAAAGDGDYAWGSSYPSIAKANIDGWYQSQTPAGWLPSGASPYGILDMNGNVREWVLDENENGEKGLKGGGFQDTWTAARSESVYYHAPESSGFNRGFRCAYEQ